MRQTSQVAGRLGGREGGREGGGEGERKGGREGERRGEGGPGKEAGSHNLLSVNSCSVHDVL